MDQWTLGDYLQWRRQKDGVLEVEEELSVDDLPQAIVLLATTPKVLWFKKIKGYTCGVVANLVPCIDVLEELLGPQPEEEFLRRLKGKPYAKEVLPFDGYEEIVVKDLRANLPILHHYVKDSAPFITSGVVHAFDPWNSVIARGIHRLEFRGGTKLGVALLNPPLKTLLDRRRERGESFPVVITIGHHPLVFIAMAMKTSPKKDKLEIAGSLCNILRVTFSPETNVEIPWGTEFVLEGLLDPKDEAPDGPMGEVNGYYLTISKTPTITVKRVFAKKEALYHAIIPTGVEADAYLTFVSRAFMLSDLKERFPFVKKIYFTHRTFGSSVIVQVEASDRALINNMMLTILSNPMVKKCVVVDEDIDPTDPEQVEWAIITRCWADEDVFILANLKGQAIDCELRRGVIHKIGINTAGKEELIKEKAEIRKANSDVLSKIAQHYLRG